MLRTGDKGAVFELESGAAPGARIGCGCLVTGIALLVPVFFLMALLPPRPVTLDCDRARGNCTWNARTVPLGDLVSASAEKGDRGGRSFRVYTVSLSVKLKDGTRDGICTAPRDGAAAQELEADVAKLSAFLADPAAPRLTLTCLEDVDTTGERIYYPIASLGMLAVAIFGLRLASRQRTQVDSKARQIVIRGSLGSGTKRQLVRFDEVSAVELKERQLLVALKSGGHALLAQARESDPLEPLAHAKSRIDAMLGGPPAPAAEKPGA